MNNRRLWLVLIAAALVLVIGAGSLSAGFMLGRFSADIAEGQPCPLGDAGCLERAPRMGPRGNGGNRGPMPAQPQPAWPTSPRADTSPTTSGEVDLHEAEQAFEAYLDELGYADLVISEVMAFELNDYAIAVEPSTGIGAMELLRDRATGRVTPEIGPNMMWNAKYGMHSGGMGGGMVGPRRGRSSSDSSMSVSASQAEAIAQRWLDESLAGHQAGEADPFYGYYTLHYLRNGQVAGMLSVNGASGDVWQHHWHGAFIAMTEHEH